MDSRPSGGGGGCCGEALPPPTERPAHASDRLCERYTIRLAPSSREDTPPSPANLDLRIVSVAKLAYKHHKTQGAHCVGTLSQLLEQQYGACGDTVSFHDCEQLCVPHIKTKKEKNMHIHDTVVTQDNTAFVRSTSVHCPPHFAMVSKRRRMVHTVQTPAVR